MLLLYYTFTYPLNSFLQYLTFYLTTEPVSTNPYSPILNLLLLTYTFSYLLNFVLQYLAFYLTTHATYFFHIFHTTLACTKPVTIELKIFLNLLNFFLQYLAFNLNTEPISSIPHHQYSSILNQYNTLSYLLNVFLQYLAFSLSTEPISSIYIFYTILAHSKPVTIELNIFLPSKLFSSIHSTPTPFHTL